MAVDSTIFAPVSEAFREGTLLMPTDIVPSEGNIIPAWADYPLNHWLVIVSAFLFLFCLRSMYRIFPDVMKCFTRWRWHLTIETNMQLAKVRNVTVLVLFLPFCLMLGRYRIFTVSLLEKVPEQWMTAAVAGIVVLYIILRLLFYGALSVRSGGSNAYMVAGKAARNHFVILVFAMLVLTGILNLFGSSDETIRTMIILLCICIYMVFVVIKSQILRSACSPLTTFLYLCALELIPTAALIAANIIL